MQGGETLGASLVKFGANHARLATDGLEDVT